VTTTVAVRLRARVTERALFAAGVVAVVSDVDGFSALALLPSAAALMVLAR